MGHTDVIGFSREVRRNVKAWLRGLQIVLLRLGTEIVKLNDAYSAF